MPLATSEDPILLRWRGEGRLLFSAQQRFHYEKSSKFAGEWKVSTDGYSYRLWTGTGERMEELLQWHWHPWTERPECHLHIGLSHERVPRLPKFHIPSHRVSLEEVLGFLIEEVGVTPLRDDWRDVLADTRQRFEKYQTWTGAQKPG